MSIIGIITVLLALFCLVLATVTGRKQWLVIWLWCIPAILISSLTPEGVRINGLAILICTIMSAEVIFSLWGIKLWCTQTRRKIVGLKAFVGFFNIALSAYCFYQSMILMEFYKISHNSKAISVTIAIIYGVIVARAMENISITAIEMYFSKREKFPIIKCSPIIKSKKGKNEVYRKYVIQGIQNGETYVFNMTQKAFLLLKPQKSFVFNAKRGVFGGVYVTGDVYNNDSKRRIKRVNRLLIKKALFVLLAAVLLILLFIRIRTGTAFEEIFTEIGRGVESWIK